MVNVWGSMDSTEDPWGRSSHAPQVRQTAQPHGSGAALGSAPGKQKWLSQAQHLACVALLLPRLQLPLGWQGDRDSSDISLPQRWHNLTCLNCSVCMLAQDVQTVQGTPLLWRFWDYLRLRYPGRALDRWELSAQHKVWVFTVFVPICQVLAVRGFVLCRLLKVIQSHS